MQDGETGKGEDAEADDGAKVGENEGGDHALAGATRVLPGPFAVIHGPSHVIRGLSAVAARPFLVIPGLDPGICRRTGLLELVPGSIPGMTAEG